MEQVKTIQANGHLDKWLKEFNELPCDEKIRRISETRVEMEKEVWFEKAQSFFRQSHYLFHLDGMDLHNFIEDFKKYVKGE